MKRNILIPISLWMFIMLGLFIRDGYAEDQNYYVINIYGRADSATLIRPIRTAFVDLDSKAITKSIKISDNGEVVNKKGVFIKKGKDTLLVSLVNECLTCPNSHESYEITKMAVINPQNLSFVYSQSDTGLLMIHFLQQPDYTAYILAFNHTDSLKDLNGFYKFGKNYSFRKVRPAPPDYAPDVFGGSGPCDLFYPLDSEKNLYRGDCWGHYSVVRTNSDRTIILESLIVPFSPVVIDSSDNTTVPDRMHIFAIKDTLLYDFNLNYETYKSNSWTKRHGQGWIKSHVNIYDNRNFVLLDSLPIPDYPKNEYIDGEFDVADISGPYIVYYFFEEESRELIIAPAMLFIFDTRTNEATWLRVGWR